MICVCGNHAWAPITKGFVTLVSPDDAKLLDNCWYASVGSKRDVYAVRSMAGAGRRKKLRLHNVIMGVERGIDHKNLNGLDNRRTNLRRCTTIENLLNRGEMRGKAIPLKGVYRHHSGKFYAAIRLHGVRYHLGIFETEREAHCAYIGASKILHGDFSRHSRRPAPASPVRHIDPAEYLREKGRA